MGQAGAGHTAGAGGDDVAALLARGELLLAFDRARDRLALDPTDREAGYQSVLALARAGATDRAIALLDELGLDRTGSLPTSDTWSQLDEDVASVRARLDKDRARRAEGADREALARLSAAGYEAAHDRSGGSFPAVNAATMWRLAGVTDRSTALARAVWEAESARGVIDEIGAYWSAATRAEAALLLGRFQDAAVAVEEAGGLAIDNRSARASTRRQLRLVCELTGAPTSILEPLSNPAVVHFCGHRIAPAGVDGRFRADHEEEVAARFAAAFADLGVGVGYGSLASGADILAAEALLARGAELHVLLPFDRDEFVDVSVADAGPSWVARFERCLGAATSVSTASAGASLGDPVLFDYCARLAMGQAIIRAEHLDAEVRQVALWDGRVTGEPAGTAVDVARWQTAGRTTVVVDLPTPPTSEAFEANGPDPGGPAGAPPPTDPVGDAARRVVRALVFADVAGFSRLSDGEVETYDRHVLTALAATIDRFGDAVLLRETWGDGIYLVIDEVPTAAACALALQRTIADIDLDGLGLGELRGLRVGAHVGPVLAGWDPITDRLRVSGRHVTTTARIEPRTPEGDVYVTEHFAAAVVLAAAGEIACQYVGRVPAAKDYGELPMYLLSGSGEPT